MKIVKPTRLFCLLVAAFSFVSISYGQGGATCLTAQAAPIISFPFSLVNEVLYDKVNDYDAGNTALLSDMSPLYIGGPDYLYYFTAPSTGPITIKLTYVGSLTKYFSVNLFKASGTSLGQNIAGSYDCFTAGVNPTGVLVTANVQAGVSYYVMVDRWNFALTGTPSYLANKTKYNIEIFYNDIAPSCANPDFETGNFSNWFGTIGRIENCKNPLATHANYCPMEYGTTSTQFSIMNGGTDAYGGFPCVFQGSYSAMIGDGTGTDAYGAQLINSFEVTNASSAFTVSYAMVMQEEASHEDTVQASIEISMFDQNGDLIPCGYFLAIAGPNSGFLPSTLDPQIHYSPWRSVTTDLSAYIGQYVTIMITVGDCSGLEHFAYAYLDCSCTIAEITASGCNPVTLTAPVGYETYLWSPGGQTTQTITVTSLGQYCCDVSQNGCTLHLCKDITVGSLNLTTSQINVSCNGMQNGSATISIVGTPNFSYVWSNGDSTINTIDTTNTINSLPVGTYIVSVTDGSGCLGTDTVNITGPSQLIINADSSQTICYGTPVTLHATVSGGVPPYSYVWDNGAGSLDSAVVNPPLGNTNYTVSVSDACTSVLDQVSINVIYCCIVDSITNNITPCTPSAGNYSISGQVYFTDPSTNGTLTITNTCGSTPVQYSAPFTSPVSYTFNNLTANANNCQINAVFSAAPVCTLSIPYTAPATVNVTPGNTLTLTCSAPSGTISANSIFSGVTYTWTGPGIVSGVATASPTVNAVGIYTVVVTDPVSGCTASGTVSVISNMSPPTITTGSPLTLTCLATSGAINATSTPSTSTYFWTGSGIVSGATTSSPTVNAAGTYIVIATNSANGCTATSSVTVLSNTVTPDVTPGQSMLIPCSPHNVNVSATSVTPGVTFNWTGPGVPSNGANYSSVTVNQAGLYTVVVTNPVNGCTSSGTVNVIPVPMPVSNISNSTNVSCNGLTDGSATVDVTGGTPPYTYQWNDHSLQSTPTVYNLASGTWSVIVIDASGCTTSSGASISEPEIIYVVTSQNINSCYNQPANIAVSVTGGTGPNYTYLWSNFATTSSIIVYPQPPDSTFSVIATDQNGCTASTSVIVHVSPPINITLIANTDSICPGEQVMLTPIITGGIGAPYMIFNQEGDVVTPPIYVYLVATGNYAVYVEDACGTHDTGNVYIHVSPMPPAGFLADSLAGCQPFTVHFNEVYPIDGRTFTWDFGDNENLSLAHNPVHTYTQSGTFDVTLTVTSKKGCKVVLQNADMITVYPKPNAQFAWTPEFATVINPIVSFNNITANGNSYIWTFGDGDSTNLFKPIHRFPGAGSWPVELIAISNKGCRDTVMYPVNIDEENTFYAPTAFSPDHDNVNDFFFVTGTGIDKNNFLLNIYDRWGEIIFSTTDIDKSWNGCAKNSANFVAVGTYTWLVIYRDTNGVKHEKSGRVTVIK